MPQGLQVWDASGNLVLDVTTRLPRILGSVQTGTSAGSVTHTGLSSGTPFYFATTMANFQNSPVGSFSGNVFSWTAGSDVQLVYGVY